jgi:hypothetical protein
LKGTKVRRGYAVAAIWMFALAFVAWHSWTQHNSRTLVSTVSLLLLVYGLWIAFATWYYHSPIPNTILAKAYANNAWYTNYALFGFVKSLFSRLRVFVLGSLGPAFGGNGTGYQLFADRGLVACFLLILAVFGCIRAWLSRSVPNTAICLYVVVYCLYYLIGMNFVFGWYVVPLAAITILGSAFGADLLLSTRSFVRDRKLWSSAFTAFYLCMHIALLPICFRGETEFKSSLKMSIAES